MNDYIDGKTISISCDHEIKTRGIKPFKWKRCNSKTTVISRIGRFGHTFDYCKKHFKSGDQNGL